jgi:hypothetical protein
LSTNFMAFGEEGTDRMMAIRKKESAMRSRLAPFVFALGASLALSAMPAPGRAASDRSHSILDDGQPIPAAWRATGAFNSLAAVGPDSVIVESGGSAQIRADGDPRVLERLRFIVKDGRLVIGRRSGDESRERIAPAVIHVSASAIHAATAAGSGRVSIDRLRGDDVSAMVAGSGTLDVHAVEARQLSAHVAGSGGLVLAGRGDTASVVLAGSGRIDGRSFTAGSARAVVTGSGEAAFRSPGQVEVTITGSGSVAVAGGATCTLRKIGSGTLRCG